MNKSLQHLSSVILLGFVFIIPSVSTAQDEWSLKKCVDYAQQNNTSINIQKNKLEFAGENIDFSMAKFGPKVEGYANQYIINGPAVDSNQIVRSTYLHGNAGIGVEIDIFKGFENKLYFSNSKLSYQYHLHKMTETTDAVSFSIAHSYLALIESYELKAIIEKQIELSDQQLEQVKVLVEAGEKAKSEQIKVELQLSKEKLRLIDAEENVTLLKQRLMKILMLPIEQQKDFSISKDISTFQTINPNSADSIYIKALMHPSVQAAELREEISKNNIKIAESYLYPRLTASYSLSTSYNTSYYHPLSENPVNYETGEQLGDNVTNTIGLGLVVPIFNKNQTKKMIVQARIDKLDSELQTIETKNNLTYEVAQLYTTYQKTERQLVQHSISTTLAEENFKFAEMQYKAGTISLIDYNFIKNQLAQEQIAYSQAKYTVLFQQFLLSYYLNGSFSFINDNK